MVFVASSRKLDIQEVLQHPLGPLPWSLANEDGTMKNTNKAALARHCSAQRRVAYNQVNCHHVKSVCIYITCQLPGSTMEEELGTSTRHPSPAGHRWSIDRGCLEITWMNGPPVTRRSSGDPGLSMQVKL